MSQIQINTQVEQVILKDGFGVNLAQISRGVFYGLRIGFVVLLQEEVVDGRGEEEKRRRGKEWEGMERDL